MKIKTLLKRTEIGLFRGTLIPEISLRIGDEVLRKRNRLKNVEIPTQAAKAYKKLKRKNDNVPEHLCSSLIAQISVLEFTSI